MSKIPTRIAVIGYFGLNMDAEKTIRQIGIEIGIPYMSLNRAIKELARENVIALKKHGKSIVCQLNRHNILTKQHLILASESFKNEAIRKKPILKEINAAIAENAPEKSCAILFGSYAKGSEQKHSDADIAIIANNQIKKMQSELKMIEHIHSIEINIMHFTEKQFRDMLTAKEENVGKQILKNNIILLNPELYWNLVYEAIK